MMMLLLLSFCVLCTKLFVLLPIVPLRLCVLKRRQRQQRYCLGLHMIPRPRARAPEVAQRGEAQGSLVVRKHIAKCFRGYPGAGILRKKLFTTQSSDEMITILNEAAALGDPRVAAAEEGT